MANRIWKSAVARVLVRQNREHPINDTFIANLLHDLKKSRSASVAVIALAAKLSRAGNSSEKTGLREVDLSAICDHIKLKVNYKPLTVDALLSRSDEGYVATVNTNSTLSRQRKSLAHEIGHLALFQATGLTQAFGHMSLHERSDQESVEIEDLCDYFASELIMPSANWREALSVYGTSLRTLRRLKESYRISYATAARRIVEVSLIECAIIIWSTVCEAEVLVKLDPARCWESITPGRKAKPPSLLRTEELLTEGSPFVAYETGVESIGRLSIPLGGSKGKYFAHSEVVDLDYIATLIVPQRFGLDVVVGTSGP